MERKTHWENVYRTRVPTDVGWYQPHLARSLELIASTGVDGTASLLDVGGGASTLVDDLVARDFRRVTVLDVSAAALQVAKARLGPRAVEVAWIEGDITKVELPPRAYDVWHDRAVFHFLTDAGDRERYVRALRHALKPDGHVVLATFGPGGPPRCSGLDVVRYSPESLQAALGGEFELAASLREDHRTPAGKVQEFVYGRFRRRPAAP